MISAQVIEERKRRNQAPGPGLREVREKFAKTYRYQTLKERLIELVFQGGTGNVAEIVARIKVDAPKCPLCRKHVLKLVVQERLQQELESKRAMLHDAEVVVVDKDYNILSVPCPTAPPCVGARDERDDGGDEGGSSNDDGMPERAHRQRGRCGGRKVRREESSEVTGRALPPLHNRAPCTDARQPSPPATPPGSPGGWSRPNARPHTAHVPRPCDGRARHAGVIRRVLCNQQQNWYGFVDASATGITPESGIYCSFPIFLRERVMKCVPEGMRHDDAAVRSWMTGKRLIFSVFESKDVDRKTGNPRQIGKIHDFIDLESAAGSAQAAASGAQGDGMPQAPFDMAAGDANAGALRPPEDPRVPSAASAPPQDPRRQAPQDPRVQRAPSDPRLLRQASASLVGGESKSGGGVVAGTGDGVVYGVMAGGSGGEAVSLAAGNDVVMHVQAADASEEAAGEKEAWLLLGGDYLCKMRVQVLQPNAHFPASAAGRGGWLLEQWLRAECPKIDLSQTISIQVLSGGGGEGCGRFVLMCVEVCMYVFTRARAW
jgi:hypothetical protein